MLIFIINILVIAVFCALMYHFGGMTGECLHDKNWKWATIHLVAAVLILVSAGIWTGLPKDEDTLIEYRTSKSNCVGQRWVYWRPLGSHTMWRHVQRAWVPCSEWTSSWYEHSFSPEDYKFFTDSLTTVGEMQAFAKQQHEIHKQYSERNQAKRRSERRKAEAEPKWDEIIPPK